MNGCNRCAAERIGGSTYSTEAHDGRCPAALRPGSTLVRDARNGAGPLSDLPFTDLADLVALYAPYGSEARAEYFRQLAERAGEQVSSKQDCVECMHCYTCVSCNVSGRGKRTCQAPQRASERRSKCSSCIFS